MQTVSRLWEFSLQLRSARNLSKWLAQVKKILTNAELERTCAGSGKHNRASAKTHAAASEAIVATSCLPRN